MKNIESKTVGGHVVETKEELRNGVRVGIIEGYIATWDVDRGDGWVRDKFVKGCFAKAIRDFKKRKRQMRFKDHHGRTVGGFPFDTLKEDDIGLFGRGEINLEVQQGDEAYRLAKQGVLVEFSVGFSAVKSTRDHKTDIRTITEAALWEGSIVDEPMNPKAEITAVKSNEERKMDPVSEIEAKEFTKRDLEDALRDGREFTKSAAKTIASGFVGFESEEAKAARELKESADLALEIEKKEVGDQLDEVGEMLDGILDDLKVEPS
jgi:HK97 family phage prohead protease